MFFSPTTNVKHLEEIIEHVVRLAEILSDHGDFSDKLESISDQCVADFVSHVTDREHFLDSIIDTVEPVKKCIKRRFGERRQHSGNAQATLENLSSILTQQCGHVAIFNSVKALLRCADDAAWVAVMELGYGFASTLHFLALAIALANVFHSAAFEPG